MKKVIDLMPYLPQQDLPDTGANYFTAEACSRRDPHHTLELIADALDAALSIVTGAGIVTFLVILLTIV